MCCSPRGCKGLDTTKRLDNNSLREWKFRRKSEDYVKRVLDKCTEVCVGCTCVCMGACVLGWNEKNIVNYDIPVDSLSFLVNIAHPDSNHLSFPWVFCTS